ncbi:MAG: type II secretion system protein [bacterium]|nr:type II secretion system protein [bacterium]
MLKRDHVIQVHSRGRRGSPGFSLVEIIVVLTVLGVVAAAAGLGFRAINEKSRIAVAASNALSDLRYAQETAMTERQDVTFTVNSGTNSYSAAYSASGALLKSPLKPTESLNVTLGVKETKGVSITAANASITFNPDGIPYSPYPSGGDLAGAVTIMTLNGEMSVVLQPSGYSEVQ